MDEKELLTQLVTVSYTKTDLTRKLRVLREFLEQKYYSQGGQTLADFLKVANCTKEDTSALLSLKSEFYKSFTKYNSYPLLNKINRLLNKEEIIHVYLPYEMEDAEKEKLGIWFKKNVNNKVILELIVDPSLILGCAFAYKGVYHNFSLKFFINSYRQDIRKLLDRYAQNP